MHYNPFVYLKSEKDVLMLVNTLISNTKGEGDKGGEDFWVKAEKMLLTALIAYIWSEAPAEEKNFSTLLEMINAMEVREDDETFKNAVDLLFERLEKRTPDHFAVRQYLKYKLAAGKTAKSILISAGARLAPFDIAEVRSFMAYDDLELDTLGDKKTALFLVMADSDKTFDFIIAMICSQLFTILMTKADDVYSGSLPVPVQGLFDEFANITIPNMEKMIAVCRSSNIGCALVVQSQAQLKAIYKDHADTIIGNCDSFLFLGGTEKTTLKETSELLGKQTIHITNKGESRGKEISHSYNNQLQARDLMTVDELSVMDGGKCIVRIRGARPFLSDKFDITKHKQYPHLADANPKNIFDVEKYVGCKLPLKAQEVFETFELVSSVTAKP